MAETCGHAGVMEFNGDVYSCDHFVFPEYKLGNIYTQSLIEMMNSPRQIAFGHHRFFKHVAPYMDFMKHELDNQRPPANVMQWVKQNPPDK